MDVNRSELVHHCGIFPPDKIQLFRIDPSSSVSAITYTNWCPRFVHSLECISLLISEIQCACARFGLVSRLLLVLFRTVTILILVGMISLHRL